MSQILDDAPDASSPPALAPPANRKLLIGAKAIVAYITGTAEPTDKESARKAARWLYGQLDKLPIFQLAEDATLFAYCDELDAHFAAKAAAARAARIAAAEAKAAEKEAALKAATAAAKAVRSASPNRAKPRQRARNRRSQVVAAE